MFGEAADIFEDSLVPYLPKILAQLAKQIKDDAPQKILQSVSESTGNLCKYILPTLDVEEQLLQLETFILQTMVFVFLEKNHSKQVQGGAIYCLT